MMQNPIDMLQVDERIDIYVKNRHLYLHFNISCEISRLRLISHEILKCKYSILWVPKLYWLPRCLIASV